MYLKLNLILLLSVAAYDNRILNVNFQLSLVCGTTTNISSDFHING